MLTWASLDTRPLVAIDQILDSIENNSASQQQLNYLTRVTLGYLGREDLWLRDRTAALITPDLTQDEQCFIGAVVLRLLDIDPDCGRGTTEFGRIVMKIIETAFAASLYTKLNIDRRTQTYERIQRFRGIDASRRQAIRSIMETTSTVNLDGSRTRLVRELKAEPQTVTLFSDKSLCSAERIGTLFEHLSAYLQASPENAMHQYEDCSAAFAAYYYEAEAIGTTHANDGPILIVETLTSVLREHFLNSPLSEPASLLITMIGKKYPLGQVGSTLSLAFQITNSGRGHATGVRAALTDLNPELDILGEKELYLGTIGVDSAVVIEFPVTVLSSESLALAATTVRWKNVDRSEGVHSANFELAGQRVDIPWADLELEDAYSLEPVEDPDELAGRQAQMTELVRLASLKSVGSRFVTGQKRVGKTSLAKTFRAVLKKRGVPVHTVFLEAGDFLGQTAAETVRMLGTLLCEEVRRTHPAFSEVPIPDFTGTLAPLNGFLTLVLEREPDFRCIFIIDEFDAVPPDLYRRGEQIATAAFQALRSVSGRAPFGFVFIGGENIRYVLDGQGSVLNKAPRMELTYLERNQGSDFEDLVRGAVEQWFEFSDRAVSTLAEITSGHPYLTKLVCGRLFTMMVERRDAHVTEEEVNEAARAIAETAAQNTFQHFWDDGVSPFEDVEATVLLRKRVLLSFAKVTPGQALNKHTIVEDVTSTLSKSSAAHVEATVDDLEKRGVLRSSDTGLIVRVPLFAEWLRHSGSKEILETLPERTAAETQWLEEEELRVSPTEIITLVDGWGHYRGKPVTEERVRAWLEQFGSQRRQRLAFKILTGVSFYNQARVREKLREAFGMVRRGLRTSVDERRVRRDILVTYFGGPGKSGSQYARLFCSENSISVDNIVETTRLLDELSESHGIQAIVVLDDFVGTGKTAVAGLRELNNQIGREVHQHKIAVHFISVTGFNEAEKSIERVASKLQFEVRVQVCDILDDSDRAFSDTSRLFPNKEERQDSRALAEEFGVNLVKKNALGYGDCQALVVFESSCPNNTLPILWARHSEFEPLFARM